MDQFIGNSVAVALLTSTLRAGRGTHAYLITGGRGVGRRTLALRVAKLVNCDARPDLRPCDACRPCRLIDRGVHPDVRLVKRAPERRVILLRPPPGGVVPSKPRDYEDNVEFIQADAQRRPVDGRRKVYVILNAEELGADAANRLLKTLEEPTSHVLFVLTASDRGAVLPTIASRSQEVRLGHVASDEIATALTTRELVEPEHALRLASLAGGAPGRALAMAQAPNIEQSHVAQVEMLLRALNGSRLERLVEARALAERWSTNADDVRATLRAWNLWLRDVLLGLLDLGARAAHRRSDEVRLVKRACQSLTIDETCKALDAVLKAQADLESNVNPRLTLDLLLLTFPQLGTSRSA